MMGMLMSSLCAAGSKPVPRIYSRRYALTQLLLIGLAACTKTKTSGEPKVAIVMPGNITDRSWNQAGYEAILKAKAQLGVDVAYSEKVHQPDQLETLSDYARRGYKVVIGHGGEFVDAASRVARSHPETLFLVTNGFVADENLSSLNFNFKHFAYVLGYLGGLMSKSGKAGWVNAQAIQVTTELGQGFSEGFRKANPAGEVLVAFTNDWDDVAKGKEAALNQISQGADVVFPTLDKAQVGALLACREKNAWSFGLWNDLYPDWPETVLLSAVMDFRVAIVDFLRMAIEGRAEGKVYTYGIGSEAGFFGQFNPAIPPNIRNQVESLIAELKTGSLP